MKRFFALLLTAALVFTLTACSAEQKEEKKEKRTTTEDAAIFTLYVNTSTVAAGGISQSSETAASNSMTGTIVSIIRGHDTLTEVKDRIDVPMSVDALQEKIVVTSAEDSDIITVGVLADGNSYAMAIADVLCEIVPRRITEIIEGTSTKIVDAPYMGTIETT